jgi:hypothetical protein
MREFLSCSSVRASRYRVSTFERREASDDSKSTLWGGGGRGEDGFELEGECEYDGTEVKSDTCGCIVEGRY